jgi:type I restriction enzyme, S subunit
VTLERPIAASLPDAAWIGELPFDWHCAQLRRLLHVQSGDFISADSFVSEGYPVFGGNGCRGFAPDWNTETGTLLIGRYGALCGNVHQVQERVWATEHAFRVFQRKEFDLRFMYYLLQAVDLNRYSARAAQPGLNSTIVEERCVPVPPVTLQVAIAALLNRETAKIDALIAKQTEILTRLEEHRRALITDAVTRGLDPSVPMQETGNIGFPSIPAHWEVRRIKQMLVAGKSGIQIGPFGTMLTDLPNHNTGFALYGQQNTISGDFGQCTRWVTEEFYRASPQYHMTAGDLVVTRKGSLGNCRVVPDSLAPGCFDSDTIRIRLNLNLVSAQFVQTVLHDAPYMEMQVIESKRGAVLGGLNSEVIGNLKIAIPPSVEQAKILHSLDSALKRVNHVRHAATELIDRLSERRAALITAAVTGQIDVTQPVMTEAAA